MNSKQTPEQQAVTKLVRRTDTIMKAAELRRRALSRAEVLDLNEASRAASYPLCWGLGTGRLSWEQAQAVCAASPARFAEIALEIARGGRGLRESLDAWIAALAT